MSTNRRKWLAGVGVGAVAGVAGAKWAGAQGYVPPDCGGAMGLGNTLTYAAHRMLVGNRPAKEFAREKISAKPFANGPAYDGKEYVAMREAGFAGWTLDVRGMVERPQAFGIEAIRALPKASQITELICEEGWSYVAEWSGARLSDVLEAAGVSKEARYVGYFSLEKFWWDSLDIEEARHGQTLVAYEMNGAPVPPEFGGPLRMRVPRQLGYKSIKYLNRLVVADDMNKIGNGKGSAGAAIGYQWFAGV
jgi:DMSO/TMAO reductase YedYZ molybdopterin-dependent catalytic subunit